MHNTATPRRRASLSLRGVFRLSVLMTMVAAGLATAGGDVLSAAGQPDGPRIDSGVTAALAKGQQPDLIVKFRGRPNLDAAYGLSYDARGRYVYETLKTHAEQSQAGVRRQLEQRHGRRLAERGYTLLWIANSLFIPAAQADILDTLRQAPEVESIRLDRAIPSPFEPLIDAGGDPGARAPGSNIARIKVPDVWALGYRGEGIVIGSIDSGVRHTHETLVNQYRGNTGSGFEHNYAWYDPYEHFPVPRRTEPHGSHTLGTAVGGDGGANQIGVAPGARWIACIGSDLAGTLYFSGLVECGQFMLAPTDTDGNNPDPDLRPAVVNNSWGDCQRFFDPWYEGVVDAWIAAGIVPVFSNGNNTNCGYSAPPGLNTVGNPGRDGKVLGIGSTGNDDGEYAPHSNWGPTDHPNPGFPGYPDHRGFPDLKPNVSAPGVSVRSAGDASDGAYLNGTGTSMSAPHVTGLVALMWQAAPCLRGDYAAIGSILMETANPVPYVTGSPSDGPGNIPNQAAGWGEIDALAAVNAALAECGPRGTAAGTVTAGDTGEAIAHARLRFRGPRDYVVIAGEGGEFERDFAAGEYSLDVDAFGYHTLTRSVTITADQTLTLDLPLDPTARHTISGVIADSVTGWPLHARIHIVQPAGDVQVWSNPETGAYTVELPTGHDYTLTVNADVPGYLPDSTDVHALDADLVEDFGLVIDTVACAAPGYAGGGGFYEDFETGDLPAGWLRVTDRPGWPGWQFGNDLGSTHFVIPPHGHYAASNDDSHPINSIARQERLITPPLSVEPGHRLGYASAYSGGFGLLASVEVSADGASWNALAAPIPTGSADAPQWRNEVVDLGEYAGQTIRLAFRTDDGGDWSSGWAIDDVQVSPPCAAPEAGALLVGRVLDSALGPEGLNGAGIAIDGAGSTISAASEDPALGDGWYTLYALAGATTVTATLVPYPDLQIDIDVPAGGVLRVDLDLAQAGDRIFRSGFDSQDRN